jgi:ABC-type Fe3+/spermidine/putrescine transport system ATPase subunit
MQAELKTLQRELGITFLFVTHDQDEALTVSDRVAVLRQGRLEQVAAAEEIYRRPATAYVAQFIGQTNLLRVQVRNRRAKCGNLSWNTPESDGDYKFSLRPECIVPADNLLRSHGEMIRIPGTVTRRTFQGPTVLLQLQCGELALLVRSPANSEIAEKQEFAFRVADLVPLQGESA